MRAKAREGAPSTDRIVVTMLGALPPWRGVSRYTGRLLDALSTQNGVSVEALDFSALYPQRLYPGGDPKGEEVAAIPPRIRVRRFLAWYNPLSWLWAGLTLKGRVVHAQWWSYILAPVYVIVLTLARMRGRKTVLTLHNLEPHDSASWQRSLYRAVFRLADHFVVHSERNKRAFISDHPAADGRISVVPMGLHAEVATVSRDEARRKLGVASNEFVVLAFGNIRPYKGIDVLLRAVRQVVDRGHHIRLVIAGKPWGSFEPYQRLIDELRLNNNVTTKLEYVPTEDVAPLFGAADLAVYPYTAFDAQSAAATLGLAYGVPLIVANAGGLPDFVADERAIVEPGDATALAEAIERVVQDEALRAKLAEDSRRLAKMCSWDAIASETFAVYQLVLAERSASIAVAGEQWR